MTTQLSNCCKATIDLDKTKERPECFTCSKCGRIIGSPLPSQQEIAEKIIHKSIDQLSKQGEGYASFYINILKAEIIKALHQELQKAREEERAFILQELALRDIPDEHGCYPFYTARQISSYLKSEWRIKSDQSELDQFNK
jgi:hypothetical protein